MVLQCVSVFLDETVIVLPLTAHKAPRLIDFLCRFVSDLGSGQQALLGVSEPKTMIVEQ